jgi:VWFA-related protein
MLRWEGKMKKIAVLAIVLGLSFPVFSQESFVEQSLVLNVEVPVRVFQGAAFVNNLTLEDFEILEDGVPQKIEACYLINRRAVQRKEEMRRYTPQMTRNFYLFFEVTDYNPKISDALNYFCANILQQGDNLVTITPLKSYRLKDQAFRAKSKEAIAEELKGLVRKDCLTGNSEYRNAVSTLTELAKKLSEAIKTGDPYIELKGEQEDKAAPEEDQVKRKEKDEAAPKGKRERDEAELREILGLRLDEDLFLYADLQHKLDVLREVSQMKLLDFANRLAREDGQKYVFLFYEREYIPQIEPTLVAEYSALYKDNPYVYQTLTQTTQWRDQMTFDTDRVKQAYADASAAIHFLFITTPRPVITGVYFEERSEDIYTAFREMARATGGIFETSADPASMFRSALEVAENYYLLYYSPKNMEDTGNNFRHIEVRMKKPGYRILYRSGYFLR